MSMTTYASNKSEEPRRYSSTTHKDGHSIRRRRDRLHSSSLQLSYTELVKEKDVHSVVGTTFQPFAGPGEHRREPADVPSSPRPSFDSSISHTSPTTPRFVKETDQSLTPDLDLLSSTVSHRKRKSRPSISLTSPPSTHSLDSLISEALRPPRSASPRLERSDRRPVRRRRDSDGALDVAMFHQRLGRRNNTIRAESPGLLVLPRSRFRTNTVPPIRVDTPMKPEDSTHTSQPIPASASSSGSELRLGVHESKPLPPHPVVSGDPPQNTLRSVKPGDHVNKRDLHVQLPVVPLDSSAMQKVKPQARVAGPLSPSSPSSRVQSPSSSILFTLSKLRLRRAASKVVFAGNAAPNPSILLNPTHMPATPDYDQSDYDPYNDRGHALRQDSMAPFTSSYGHDDWDTSGLRSGTPLPRLVPEVEDPHRVKVTMVRGDVCEEKELLEVLPALRMLRTSTKPGRS